MSADERPVTDPIKIAAYVKSAERFYLSPEGAGAVEVELADPPVVVKTESGAKVMAWLPIDDEDLVA